MNFIYKDDNRRSCVYLNFLVLEFARVTFDGNTFIPPKAVQKNFVDLLHSYCLGQHRPKIFYYSAITIAPLFVLNCFRCEFLMHKIEPFWNSVQLCCQPDLLVFYTSTYDGNLICAIKHFIVRHFLETIPSSLLR